MNFESYKQFYDGGDRGTTIRVGGARASFSFSATPKKDKKFGNCSDSFKNLRGKSRFLPDFP